MRMRSERSPEPTSRRRVSDISLCAAASCWSFSLAASQAMALARFLCWERSSWHSTTMPEGMWVMRTAESVLFTCWPPAPEAR
ncbi:hypothetical protein D3C85_1646890 [compost metagenome]